MENLFCSKDASLEHEVFFDLLRQKNVRIEKILSMGQTSTEWYDQDEDEWVCVLEGEAELTYEDGSHQRLGTGDHVLLPAHKRHKVSYTSKPCVWLCVFIG